jgi:ParB family transcriptional regulator, chromosome partitioning protein
MGRAKIVEFKDIKLDDLVFGHGQVRTSDVGVGIAELATNIRENGLLQPIVVAPAPDGKYEIILGQRRFLAHEMLGEKKIRAGILSSKVSEIDAKIISLSENMMRKSLNNTDNKDVCTYLYQQYLSMSEVAKKTGLPYAEVRKYVKVDRLPEKIKKVMEDENIDAKDAIDAWDAVNEKEEDIPRAVAAMKEFKKLDPGQKQNVKKVMSDNPLVDVKQAVSIGSTQTIHKVSLAHGPKIHDALQKYGASMNMDLPAAASELVEEGLLSSGFLDEDED